MVNPALTVLLDLALVGSALFVAGAMAVEAWVERHPCVGARRRSRTSANAPEFRRSRPARTRDAVGGRRAA